MRTFVVRDLHGVRRNKSVRAAAGVECLKDFQRPQWQFDPHTNQGETIFTYTFSG